MDSFRRVLRYDLIIISAVLVLGLLLFYFLLRDAGARADKISQARQADVTYRAAADNLSALKQQAQQAEAYASKIDGLLPVADKLLGYPDFISSLARSHQVALTFGFSGDPVLSKNGVPGYVNFSLQADGSLSNLQDFLRTLEMQSPRFLTSVERIDLTSTADIYRLAAQGRVFSM